MNLCAFVQCTLILKKRVANCPFLFVKFTKVCLDVSTVREHDIEQYLRLHDALFFDSEHRKRVVRGGV
jgi:hypothetical protein